MTIITKKGSRLFARFRYDPRLVARLRQSPAQWDKVARAWTYAEAQAPFVPLPQDPALLQKLETLKQMGKDRGEEPDPPLFPYQAAGVKRLRRSDGLGRGVILADDMGLGKTLQIISVARDIPGNILIICPASLKWNWAEEIRKWTTAQEADIEVLEGRKPSEGAAKAKWTIINYDILAFRIKELKGFSLIVCDEAHYLKNQKTQRYKAVASTMKQNPQAKIILATGTPMQNRPAELWPLLELIHPGAFDWWAYAFRYCNARRKYLVVKGGKKKSVWDFSGSSHLEELAQVIAPYMIRRRKADVLDQLPEKIQAVRWVDIDHEDYSRSIQEALLEYEGEYNPLVVLSAARQAAARGKIDAVLEMTQEILDEGNKVLLFAVHHEIIKRYKDHFGHRAVVLTGKTPQAKRQEVVRQFQSGQADVFIGQIQAAGVGLNLTAATYVIFAELGWTPADHEQAMDRAYRIGQKNTVHVYFAAARNTVEERIMALLMRKDQVISRAMMQKKAMDYILAAFEKRDTKEMVDRIRNQLQNS